MDTLRHSRIAEISNYDLDTANESWNWTKDRLAGLNRLNNLENISKEVLLYIHLTTDDIYLLEKRIGYLLDKQLDEYHSASPSYSWDKKKACELLKQATDAKSIVIPLAKLVNVLHSSLWRISRNDKVEVLQNLAIILGTEGYIGIQRAKDLLKDCDTCE
jgi:hypothetical protein